MAFDGSPDRSPHQTSTKRHSFRQRSPVILGVVCGGTCLLVLGFLARGWADNPQPLLAAWVVFVLAVMWCLFVRPSVTLDGVGVTIHNIVRDIDIPWERVSDVESRWNLKVFVDDKGYTAWAVTSQIERPKGMSGGLAGSFMPGRFDKYAESRQVSAPAPRVTARSVAQAIENATHEYAAAVAKGALPALRDPVVRVTWVPLPIAVLVLPALTVLIVSLT